MVGLTEPLALGTRVAPNRIWFGPHETNLARGRAISDRHVAYYRRRAEGGAGVIVTETASVHALDWPYERAPLAAECVPGWRAVAEACHAAGTVVLAGIGHAGSQGSSAYSQRELWAPSRVPDVVSREVPKAMDDDDVADVLDGFRTAARLALLAGCDGVEVNAGQHSLLRQFVSGLTNVRADGYGQDRLLFVRDVLAAVREGLAPGAVVALRLSCDELAPWAGITPDMAAGYVVRLARQINALVVVKGSALATSSTRPDGHVPVGFNLELAAQMRAAVAGRVPVVAQGSIVDVAMAAAALAEGRADAVEMTRALIADATLPAKVAARHPERIRPCILCNQVCQVRDARNPIVSCVADPASGHEWEEETADIAEPAPATGLDVMVVGGGVAGLELARVAAGRGHRVRVHERTSELGGSLRIAAVGAGRARLAALAQWLQDECVRLGVELVPESEVTPGDVETARAVGTTVVLATGSRAGLRGYTVEDGAVVVPARDFLASGACGPVAVWDPVGGPVGVSVAELMAGSGHDVTVITSDQIAGNELARSGDLAPANVRLQQAGVHLATRSLLRVVRPGEVEVEDRFTGATRTIPASLVVDAGHRLPDDELWAATGSELVRIGDAVAPRTVYEAVLEARRAAATLDATRARSRR